LVARTKSGKRAQNFAHRAIVECVGAYETMLHRVSKQIIADNRWVRTPDVIAVHANVTTVLRPPCDLALDVVTLEHWLDGMRPDIIGRVERSGRVKDLLVEIFVTHRCDDEKIQKIHEQAIAAIEIDLSQAPRRASKEQLEDLVLRSAPRQWLFNPIQVEWEADAEHRREEERREARRRRDEQRAEPDRQRSPRRFGARGPLSLHRLRSMGMSYV
jgi:hypothetical protein